VGFVTPQEADLLRMARAIVGGEYDEVERLLCTVRPPPNLIGPTARLTLEDTLSKGVVLSFARLGGWRDEGDGRLWERAELPPLQFTSATVVLLQWLLRANLLEKEPAKLTLPKLRFGDELMLVLTLKLLQGTPCEHAAAMQTPFRTSVACWLFFPGVLATVAPLEGKLVLDLEHDKTYAFVLDAWQSLLARQYGRLEREKSTLVVPEELTRIGRAQEQVLEAMLGAFSAIKRRDLASFLIEAAQSTLFEFRQGEDLVASLSATSPLRERGEARRAAGGFLRAVVKLRGWDQEHRAVRFFDDEYQQAQRLVKQWERFGDAGFRQAERLLSELENPV
jgi:hypothetical protein